MSRALIAPAPDLVERFLAAMEGQNATSLGITTGIDASHIARWRRGYRPKRLNPATESALRMAIEAAVSAPMAGRVGGPAPTQTFVEHVLFTAGRIAELAQQIAHAAEQQRRVCYELGQRAQSAQLAMPDARERDEAETLEVRKQLDAKRRSAAKKKSPHRAAG